MVTCTRPDGLVERVGWADLKAVIIKTTTDGPFGDDFFWMLVGNGLKSGCVVPSESVGCDRLLKRLQQLPGFDNWLVVRACQSTQDNQFLVWEPDMLARVKAALDSPVEFPTSLTQNPMPLGDAIRRVGECADVPLPIALDTRDFKIRFNIENVSERQVQLPTTPGMTVGQVLTKLAEQVDGEIIYGCERIVLTTRHS
jgi:hypothetical protein